MTKEQAEKLHAEAFYLFDRLDKLFWFSFRTFSDAGFERIRNKAHHRMYRRWLLAYGRK